MTWRACAPSRPTVPDHLTLRLRPYRDSGTVDLVAKFRYRITDGHLTLGVKLIQADEAQRRAWLGIVDTIRDHFEPDPHADELGRRTWAERPLVVNGRAPEPAS